MSIKTEMAIKPLIINEMIKSRDGNLTSCLLDDSSDSLANPTEQNLCEQVSSLQLETVPTPSGKEIGPRDDVHVNLSQYELKLPEASSFSLDLGHLGADLSGPGKQPRQPGKLQELNSKAITRCRSLQPSTPANITLPSKEETRRTQSEHVSRKNSLDEARPSQAQTSHGTTRKCCHHNSVSLHKCGVTVCRSKHGSSSSRTSSGFMSGTPDFGTAPPPIPEPRSRRSSPFSREWYPGSGSSTPGARSTPPLIKVPSPSKLTDDEKLYWILQAQKCFRHQLQTKKIQQRLKKKTLGGTQCRLEPTRHSHVGHKCPKYLPYCDRFGDILIHTSKCYNNGRKHCGKNYCKETKELLGHWEICGGLGKSCNTCRKVIQHLENGGPK